MTKYIFVNDLFVEDYIGGAELTSESLIKVAPSSVKKIKSSTISESTIEEYKNYIWIFGNFTQMKANLLMRFIKEKVQYHIVEYDFKFCKLRSPEKHALTQDECKCENDSRGRLISVFFAKAQGIWYMSQRQQEIYQSRFPFLKETPNHVLSSIFDTDLIEKLIQVKTERDDRWVILDSPSWIKGTETTIEMAKKSDIPYKLVGGISYNDMLNTLARSKGLIFFPRGGDTCPRIVIEARLLGCELMLNNNVLHKNEEWFCGTKDDCANYLKTRASFFWETLEKESL